MAHKNIKRYINDYYDTCLTSIYIRHDENVGNEFKRNLRRKDGK